MKRLRRHIGNPYWRPLLAGLLVLTLAACGGDSDDGNPAGPSGSGGSGGSGSGGSGGGSSANSGLNVTIDGAAYTPLTVTAARANPGVPVILIAAGNAAGTAFAFGAPERVNVHRISPTELTNANMTIVSGATATGYLASQTIGSGSVTFTSITATQVVGRVDLTLAPSTGSGPNKRLVGTFTLPLAN